MSLSLPLPAWESPCSLRKARGLEHTQAIHMCLGPLKETYFRGSFTRAYCRGPENSFGLASWQSGSIKANIVTQASSTRTTFVVLVSQSPKICIPHHLHQYATDCLTKFGQLTVCYGYLLAMLTISQLKSMLPQT